MITENINKEAINTQRRLALSCSSQTAYRHLQKVEETYRRVIESMINEAIEKRYLIVANLDDYHNIHTHQRPLGGQGINSNSHAYCSIQNFYKYKGYRIH